LQVLGDSELIVAIALQTNEFAVVRDRGSIDTPATKTTLARFWRAARRAFKKKRAA